MKTYCEFKAQIPSNINNISLVVRDIVSFVKELYITIDDDILFEIRVIFNELVLNAIKHGNDENLKKLVNVKARLYKGNYLIASIEDEGNGYDSKCLIDNNHNQYGYTELCDMKETGRGILIVESLCDRMRINKRGNKIIVVKKLL